MLTAKGDPFDRVIGLEIGADDYLPKPFDVREFIARVRALVRRDRVLKGRNLRVGGLEVDTRLRTVSANGNPLTLTRIEYEVLELLAGNVGRVVTRDMLLDLVWQDPEPGSNKVDVAVRSLRRKLSGERLDGLVRTVYGVGYQMEDSAENT